MPSLDLVGEELGGEGVFLAGWRRRVRGRGQVGKRSRDFSTVLDDRLSTTDMYRVLFGIFSSLKED